MSTWTIGRLARHCGLSRSTLLYYDSIDLLKPSGRSSANYRVYTEADALRLQQICKYREAGLALDRIQELLDAPPTASVALLEAHLDELNRTIARYREQQRVVLRLLENRALLHKARSMDKEQWVELLRASGLDDEAMDRWHIEFERMAPEAHRDFLESLGIDPEEIESIRQWARNGTGAAS